MQLPRDLLILALPSMPGRRRQASFWGSTIWAHQRLAVDGVELVHDLAALLQHGHLVLAYGHGGGRKAVMSAAWLMG